MTAGPKYATPTKKGRYYAKDDERFISVTNVIDTVVNKPALVGWAAKAVATEAVEMLADPVRAVGALRLVRTEPELLLKELKGAPYAARDAAANLGSAVHALAEAHSLGHELREMDPDETAMVEQYLAFLEDFRPTFIASEATVASRKHGYAGTLDAIVEFPDLPSTPPLLREGAFVVDYKTGRTGPYPEWALQLAAYRNAECLWLPDGTEVPMPDVVGGLALRIRPDGYALHPMETGEAAFTQFAAMVPLARFLHDDADALVGERLIPIVPAAEVA